MALVTGVIDTVLYQHHVLSGAVGIVTIAAYDFTFANRMMGWLEALGTLFGMAGKADGGLTVTHQHRVFLNMNGMAGGAGHLVIGVFAAGPMDGLAIFVATEANGIALCQR